MAPTKQDITRVALYIRVSTEDQARFGDSLQAQEDALVQWASDKGHKIVGIYRDEGNSARKPALKRPVMLHLLEDVKAGKVDLVAFTKLDRWFRNLEQYYAVQPILDKHNVAWQAILEDYQTVTADGRLKVNIMLSVAENESDRTSERIKFVFDAKRRRKETILGTNNTPFGYKIELIDGARRLVKDPETQPILEDFWAHLKAYRNVRAAAQLANERYGLARSYKTWTEIAKNEIYTGTHRGIEDFCPAYIDRTAWEELRAPHGQVKNTQHPDRVYLFAGLIACPACGKKLAGSYCTHRKPSGDVEYRSYRCPDRVLHLCSNRRSVSEKKLESQLLAVVRAELEQYVLSVETSAKATRKPRATADAAKLSEQLRRLNVVYMAGNMDDAEYSRLTAELNAKIEKARQTEHESRPPDLTALKTLLDSEFEAIYESLEPADRRRMWRAIISEIHVQGNDLDRITFRA